MITRTSSSRPRLVASTAGRGAVVRGVVALRLRSFHSFVGLPSPTQQYGGIDRYPPGTVLRVDIGDARHCSGWTAELLSGAVRDCAAIEVTGTDAYGVAETRDALTKALNAGVSPAC
jgi:hypothetical protein